MIKDMSLSYALFYDIPRSVTMGYEKWYTSLLMAQSEEICAFLVPNNVNLHVDFTFSM